MTNTSQQQSSPRILRRSITASLWLAFAACGGRYELGELSQPIDPADPIASATIGHVIIDEAADLGSPVSKSMAGASGVGDVDGDGYDDWFTSGGHLPPALGQMDMQLVYGGPRLVGDVYREDRLGPTVRYAAWTGPAYWSPSPAGDVNGDGYADMLTSSQYRLNSRIGAIELGDQLLEHWGEQRAYLLYGGPRASSSSAIVLAEAAVGFAPVADIQADFAPELALETDPEDNSWWIDHRTTLVPLGDIDADGFDDVAYTYFLEWKGGVEDGGSWQDTASPGRVEAVTYLLYGSATRLPMDNPTASASAVLPGVTALSSIGDVNGDGYHELVATQAGQLFILPGTGAPLGGSVDPELSGIGLGPSRRELDGGSEEVRAVTGIGDFDSDGFGDLMLSRSTDGEASATYLFYGSADRLQRALVDADADATLLGEGTQGVRRLGDWTGDGLDDLLVVKQSYAGDSMESWQNVHSVGVVIPGRAERYAGVLSAASLAVAADGRTFTGGLQIEPMGDIDGDGFADAQVISDGPQSLSIKYGAPLGAVIY